ncbi:MAG TPA: mechanosensitive ion channel family protein [Kiritimatiellia bacterium]|nr:mechanosensitive ion channel family protein [Kiritimatiellia bacterium]HMO97714.1 mechanosensitive ion channel family protein [Kiritimatiellia bacterium]HMP97084.1 mechanosensitive ion channel family protein [Kiritimatiellia bacterium]
MNIDWNTTLIAGNELWRLLTLFGVITIAMIAAKLGKAALLQAANRFEGHGRFLVATGLRALAKSIAFAAVALAFPIGAAFLNMGDAVGGIVRATQAVLISLAVGFTLYQMVDVVFIWLHNRAVRSGSGMDNMLVPVVRTSLRVTIIILTLLQVAQSLTDKPLTSIIAGLGVGGLAVALAAQDTIKHFFGSLVLFADKPFQVGERVTVDAVDGTIEEVGFRSTRIRTLEGHLVTIPNGDLANKTIINITRRPHIRHRSVFSITYDTPPAKVERAIVLLKELLADHEGMDAKFPPRVAFHEYGAASLNILVLFWYHPGDYWSYMGFLEKLNLRILETFNREGIDFAFPTQTLYLAGDSKRPLPAAPRV